MASAPERSGRTTRPVTAAHSFQPPEPHGRLARQGYVFLRSEILSGRMRAGTLLAEGKVARLLNTSATPVRQALRILLHEGLVMPGPRRQLVVREFSPAQRRELIEVREALERIAIARTCTAISLDDLDTLHLLLLRQKRAAEAGDEELFIELDERFHLQLAAAAQLEMVPKILRELRGFVRLMRLGTKRRRGHLVTVYREHRAILDAIEGRDPEAAFAALVSHLHTADYD
jgi:DNA-binding GntR family transcriptional regulator